MSNRLLEKCMRCEVDQGFWNPEVLDEDGEIITPRTLVHPRIPEGDFIRLEIGAVNGVFVHKGGPNRIWRISELAESYRGRE